MQGSTEVQDQATEGLARTWAPAKWFQILTQGEVVVLLAEIQSFTFREGNLSRVLGKESQGVTSPGRLTGGSRRPRGLLWHELGEPSASLHLHLGCSSRPSSSVLKQSSESRQLVLTSLSCEQKK